MRFWSRYVPVAERRAKAQRRMTKLQKQGKTIQPVEIDGRTIARTFWGKGWCDHLESFSDYANRLPRGRTYARNGSICHLEILPGRIEAMVSGSELYEVTIAIEPLKAKLWKAIRQQCAGRIGSLLELLRGRFSDQVMAVVTHRTTGLFPQPGEIRLQCSCPDWAVMCKHVAAVLYGVGNRLDDQPELLFCLRGVNAGELIATPVALPTETTDTAADTLADDALADIFGIDLETEAPAESKPTRTPKKSPQPARSKTRQSTATPKRAKKSPPAAPKRSAGRKAVKPTPMKTPTGKSLARLRKQMGLTVAQFATALGVTAPSVYRWEKTPGKLNLQQRPLNALRALQGQPPEKSPKQTGDAPRQE
ncbi:helix-turn-helix domain-containing protein [Desulfatitalea alkaliphila]|uniref:Helix-turn-helix domain-containing protein n=1 Tax=Desulfatitalea alkaliphila TaxID=2929485 RepID=A0AA41UJ74_9BACT|nr:helix-turn-helix domain-containing protein [Desulfatitalea alkaliphila]MCJ8500262.1 helix-turn-helix domain-containing protein [Desulfatitalea alkaliphila]